MIGTLHPSCAVARPEVAVPTFSSAGLHVGGKGVFTIVVVGIADGLSIHGTLADTAEYVVDLAGTFDAGDVERPADEPHADKITVDIRKASGPTVSFLLISMEVYHGPSQCP
jgi:hypothetical protein